ncbi:DNA polymerase epsilon subunit 3 [Morella rubra]|uniref:DNA polymerase epsilon subunit 3 n=1 Tax=Morella rubra TaxID=262757 RepID=A0A6A1WFG8_9ROSI|nr:DNA polymerase epsilon subunit 3 [Morella rubra]
MEKVVSDAEELPRSIVRRVVKDKLSQCSQDGDLSLHKDALLAFSESARIFIHYLSATANDICRESKRQTINADDVLKALEEIEFPEFLKPLKASLDGKTVLCKVAMRRRIEILLYFEQVGWSSHVGVCNASLNCSQTRYYETKNLLNVQGLFADLLVVNSLGTMRQKNAGKKARAAKEKEVKKRKMEEEAPRKSGSGEMDEDEEDQDVTHDD